MSTRTLLLAFVAAGLLVGTVGCQGGSGPGATGTVEPTVAGRAPASFPSAAAARQAFTRASGEMTATLQDSAWLRFLGNPSEIAKTHRGYFEYGYTTFDILLRAKEYPQAVTERYTLEDSNGRSVCGQPRCFDATPTVIDQKWHATFSLSFQHMLTKDIEWIRLTRAVDGASATWNFRPDACAPAPAPAPAPCAPAPCAPAPYAPAPAPYAPAPTGAPAPPPPPAFPR